MLNIERPIAHQSSITFFLIHPGYVIDNSCIQRTTQQMRHEYVLTKTSTTTQGYCSLKCLYESSFIALCERMFKTVIQVLITSQLVCKYRVSHNEQQKSSL